MSAVVWTDVVITSARRPSSCEEYTFIACAHFSGKRDARGLELFPRDSDAAAERALNHLGGRAFSGVFQRVECFVNGFQLLYYELVLLAPEARRQKRIRRFASAMPPTLRSSLRRIICRLQACLQTKNPVVQSIARRDRHILGGAQSGTRTRTAICQGILSPQCLPIPPSEPFQYPRIIP